MIIDHVGWAFVNTNSIPAMIMHTIGKITGPIMFYYIAEGNYYSKNHKKYIERLVLFALISHIPYRLFFNYGKITILPMSVIFTLLCGQLALRVYEKVETKSLKFALIVLLIAVTFWADWGLWGVLFAMCFGIFRGEKQKQWIAYLMVNCFKVVKTVLMNGWNWYMILPVVISPFLVLLLLHLYNGSRGGNKISKWIFYIIYPTQFLVIGGVWLLFQ